MTPFTRTLQAELLKTRRSGALPIVAAAAGFVPSIILVARLVRRTALPALYRRDDYWTTLWQQANEALALILLTSLVVQIEYRNNAWKQVHASPQTLPRIFAAKLLVIVAAVVALFIDILPIVATQYALALRCKSFATPIAAGFCLWLAALGGLNWKYSYCMPYAYGALDYLAITGQRALPQLPTQLAPLALTFSAMMSLCGLAIYVTRSDRG